MGKVVKDKSITYKAAVSALKQFVVKVLTRRLWDTIIEANTIKYNAAVNVCQKHPAMWTALCPRSTTRPRKDIITYNTAVSAWLEAVETDTIMFNAVVRARVLAGMFQITLKRRQKGHQAVAECTA